MPSNEAAYIPSPHAQLRVSPAPLPTPGPDEVLIANHAVAMNPVDWKIQAYNFLITEYPAILGTDLAGTVQAVGANVSSVKAGDRVLAHALGLATRRHENNSFQRFTLCPALTVAKLPDSIPFAEGAVLPLALSTAAQGLFREDALALTYPSLQPNDTGKVLLVWGAASSVGSAAVQLARAAGVAVVCTASERNEGFCKSLGAEAVVDYRGKDVVGDVLAAIRGRELVGAFDAIGESGTLEVVGEIVRRAGGRKRVASVMAGKIEGVECVGVMAALIGTQYKDVAVAVWQDYVGPALAEGKLKCAPEPKVVGKGLESIQNGLDILKQGVSASKIVVEL